MNIQIKKHDIGGEIISILTKGMYPDPRDALREYVQNGIDAGANRISIRIRGDSITVDDDGVGMDEITLRKAIRVGVSDKDPKVDVGFRGIGIYSAFHICDKLSLYTRKENDESLCLSFNFKNMREVLEKQQHDRLTNGISGDELIDLQSLLGKHIEIFSIPESSFSKSGTRVEMIHLDPSFFKPLLRFDDVASYLRQVVPVRFDSNNFRWAEAIESEISKRCKEHSSQFKLIDLELQVSNRVENIYRPYEDNLFDIEPQKPVFHQLKAKDNFFGVSWGCLNSGRSTLKNKELRGFLIRKQGFAIGKRSDIEKYFGRNTFFNRYIGEIIVVHPDLIPNAARTDFEYSTLRTQFFEILTEVAGAYNEHANQYQEYTKADDQLEFTITKLNNIESKYLYEAENTDELITLIVQVRDAIRETEGRIGRNSFRPERTADAKSVLSAARALEKQIQSLIDQPSRASKQGAKSPEQKAETRRRKLAKARTGKERKEPENLTDIFEILEITEKNDISKALDIIDEKIIQMMSNNKTEYKALLIDLMNELDDALSGE